MDTLLCFNILVMLLIRSVTSFNVGKSSAMKLSMSSSSSQLKEAILLQGQVMHGYGRGSKKLGVPTANLPHFDEQLRENNIQQGVYYGWSKLYGKSGKEVPCVANIGKSPTFEDQKNPTNIVEVHLIDPTATSDFYGEFMRVALVGFLRPEKKFDGIDALIKQINQDVKDATLSCISTEPTIYGKAREFLSSDFESDPIHLRNLMKLCLPIADEKLESNILNLKTLWGLFPLQK